MYHLPLCLRPEAWDCWGRNSRRLGGRSYPSDHGGISQALLINIFASSPPHSPLPHWFCLLSLIAERGAGKWHLCNVPLSSLWPVRGGTPGFQDLQPLAMSGGVQGKLFSEVLECACKASFCGPWMGRGCGCCSREKLDHCPGEGGWAVQELSLPGQKEPCFSTADRLNTSNTTDTAETHFLEELSSKQTPEPPERDVQGRHLTQVWEPHDLPCVRLRGIYFVSFV